MSAADKDPDVQEVIEGKLSIMDWAVQRTVVEMERQWVAEVAEREYQIIHGTGDHQPMGILNVAPSPSKYSARWERKGPAQ